MWPQHLLLATTLVNIGPNVDAFTSLLNSPSKSRVFSSSCENKRNRNCHLKDRLSSLKMEIDEDSELASLMNGSSLFSHNLFTSVDKLKFANGMPWRTTIGKTNYEKPTLYMPFWEWQMEHMQSSLTNLQPSTDLDCFSPDSKYGYNENLEKGARIVNQCFKSDEYRKIRMTYYDAGDNTQVFNSVWYPDPKYNLPILGIDILAFNRKKYLAIVDFQPIHEDEADHAVTFEHLLEPIKNKYESLKGRMSTKFYDETQFFSQQMLFARFDDEAVVMKDLFPAFKQYVKLHNDLIKTTPVSTDEEQQKVLKRQTAYDTYSAERDPATALFCSMFGKKWGEDFVFDFLFSRSEKKEEGLVIPDMPGSTSVQRKSRISQHKSKNADEREGNKSQQIVASKTIEHTNVM